MKVVTAITDVFMLSMNLSLPLHSEPNINASEKHLIKRILKNYIYFGVFFFKILVFLFAVFYRATWVSRNSHWNGNTTSVSTAEAILNCARIPPIPNNCLQARQQQTPMRSSKCSISPVQQSVSDDWFSVLHLKHCPHNCGLFILHLSRSGI